MTARMHPDDLRELARLIADELRQPQATPKLVDAKTLAAELGVTSAFVYEHAGELGAIRLGNGPRARLRFDVDEARESIAARTPTPDLSEPRPRGSRRPRAASGGGIPLLPIKGSAPIDMGG